MAAAVTLRAEEIPADTRRTRMRRHQTPAPRGSPSQMSRTPLPVFCLALSILITEQVFCFQFHMAENSFDDEYIGCTDQMETLAPEILKKERKEASQFDKSWNRSSTIWQERKSSLGRLPDGFKDEYGIALLVFTITGYPIRTQMSQKVMAYGQDPKSFGFHSLHFYLTRALTLLRPECDGKPLSTFSHYPIPYGPPSDPQSTVRLFHFLLLSRDTETAKIYDTAPLSITTCFGANLLNLSYHTTLELVLIPVNEMFQITSYSKERSQITLQTTNKRCSYYNCAYLGGKKRENCTYIPRSSAPTIMKFSEGRIVPLLVAMGIAIFSATSFLRNLDPEMMDISVKNII